MNTEQAAAYKAALAARKEAGRKAAAETLARMVARKPATPDQIRAVAARLAANVAR